MTSGSKMTVHFFVRSLDKYSQIAVAAVIAYCWLVMRWSTNSRIDCEKNWNSETKTKPANNTILVVADSVVFNIVLIFKRTEKYAKNDGALQKISTFYGGNRLTIWIECTGGRCERQKLPFVFYSALYYSMLSVVTGKRQLLSADVRFGVVLFVEGKCLEREYAQRRRPTLVTRKHLKKAMRQCRWSLMVISSIVYGHYVENTKCHLHVVTTLWTKKTHQNVFVISSTKPSRFW